VNMDVVYYSSVSGNTKRFVESLDLENSEVHRIPLRKADALLEVTKPFVLIIPSYGGEAGERPVLPPIIRFLNNPANRALIVGVVCCGNTNFGATYCKAGIEVAAKCKVPLLAKVEIFGTPEQVSDVKSIIEHL